MIHTSESSTQSEKKTDLSIIIPTYNESKNILRLIESIRDNLLNNINTEIIVVDDNSPDNTGKIAENYIRSVLRERSNSVVTVLHRKIKNGLISAILDGVKMSTGKNIIIMDADFSHPPEIIPKMIEEFFNSNCDLLIASRYVKGGSIEQWSRKRRLLSSGATKIAQYGLKIQNKDPLSGYFMCKRSVIQNINFDSVGYKILLEILVKNNNLRITEIPYKFIDRKSGESKLHTGVILDYIRSVWRLYRYGQKLKNSRGREENRKSVRFLSKMWRFYSVGACGATLNYVFSYLLTSGMLMKLYYLIGTVAGIAISIIFNFMLNKIWTFEDKDFSKNHFFKQLGLYIGLNSVGAVIQLSLVYFFVQSYNMAYPIALILAAAVASGGNFIFNKKFTFGEKIWE